MSPIKIAMDLPPIGYDAQRAQAEHSAYWDWKKPNNSIARTTALTPI